VYEVPLGILGRWGRLIRPADVWRAVRQVTGAREPRKSMASPLNPSIVTMPVYPLTLTISTRFRSPPAQLKSNTLFRSGTSSECLINFIPPQPASTFFLRGFSNLLLPSFVTLLLTSSTCLFLYLLSHSNVSVPEYLQFPKFPHPRSNTDQYKSHHGTSDCSPVSVSGIFNRLHQRTVFL